MRLYWAYIGCSASCIALMVWRGLAGGASAFDGATGAALAFLAAAAVAGLSEDFLEAKRDAFDAARKSLEAYRSRPLDWRGSEAVRQDTRRREEVWR